MDYKELLNRLHEHSQSLAAYNDQSLSYTLEDAVSAIETILAERDAAFEDLKGRCDICKHRRVCIFDEQHRIGCANSKRAQWQWRGPQKGSGV